MFAERVNVFHGCGEIDPKPEGIAKKWFFLKAGCGNTNPAAVLPFGKMSVCAYAGGYPTGYGDHRVSCWARPTRFPEGKKLIGFSHLQQTGTGTIGYYYNYLTVTPYFGELKPRYEYTEEYGEPGYYSCVLDGKIRCELTVTKDTAFHRYNFRGSNGKFVIDYLHHDLDYDEKARKTVTDPVIDQIDEKTVTVGFTAEGIKMFFAVKADCGLSIENGMYIAGNAGDSHEANISVSVSLRSAEKALANLDRDNKPFDSIRSDAHDVWEKMLSKIKISADDETQDKFYSNLYHSLIKPSDFDGESFVYDGDGAFVTDLATLWDMYKSDIPLICMLDGEISLKICNTIMQLCDALGNIPNSTGLTSNIMEHSGQARMLGCYTLINAYKSGIPIDPVKMLDAIEKDLLADNKTDFTVDHKCESNTWFLDMAEVCGLAEQICRNIGDDRAELFAKFADTWEMAFDKNTGLLSDDSKYYEGTLWHYSFRPMVNMEKRIELAGGREKYIELLDRFFGYGADDVELPVDTTNYQPVADGYKLNRFDGFNNETDTDAPFSYILAGRHDRACEVLRAGLECMFRTGRGGIPGNNDTGAMSAYYVYNAMGIHPVTGFDYILITSPVVDSAVMSLSNGNKIEIDVKNNSKENIYVSSVAFNGRKVENYMIPLSDFLNGGKIEFVMTDRK